MKRLFVIILGFMTVFGCFVFYQSFFNQTNFSLVTMEKTGYWPELPSSLSSQNQEDLQARWRYEYYRLRDPRTGKIPADIRIRELAYAKTLPKREDLLRKGAANIYTATWVPRGPRNVGGRTRALAIDLNFNGTTNRRILAGGVSGGMFLSEDDGATWNQTTSLSFLPSVTTIAQDPNNTNVWYYGTGEFLGNSAGAPGAGYLGQGIFKSTDGGKTWTQLPSTLQNNKLTVFDSFFDFVWTIAVHPQTSDVFAATFAGILKSTDGGDSWAQVLGRTQSPFSKFTDVAIASNGTVYATLSRNGGNFQKYGVFQSTNGGTNWNDITPADLSTDPYRMVLGVAPSDPNTVYLLVQANSDGAVASDHQFFRYDASTNTWTNLSTSLPDEQGVEGNASFSTQGGYDMIVKVKPDNPEVVWIGGTNLYRSTDGGKTFVRVGGYAVPANFSLYDNHHPDQHSIAFYPNNPNAMITGHDGGLSKTTNDLEQPQTWTLLNNGYLTSQFYAIATDPKPGNVFLVGGMQDNGSWGTESNNFQDDWFNLIGGDGGFAAIAPGGLPFYASSQNGNIVRVTQSNNQLVGSLVTPAGAQNFLFVTPYLLDPNDARVMYLAAGNQVWRNSNLDSIPEGNQDPTDINWAALDSSAAPANMQVTALAVTRFPADRLYFAATDFENNTIVKRVDNAPSNPTGTDITPPGIAAGSAVSSIAVNPNNGDEILVTISNYNVPRIWHSTDGGTNWSNVEGNLGGENGPSVRWGVIAPGVGYFLATSVGIFSTQNLNGANTVWVQEGNSVIGNVVVNMIVHRPEDGLIVAATHGRGAYSAQLAGGGLAMIEVNVQNLTIEAKPDETGSTQFTLSNAGTAPLTYNITATGQFTSSTENAHLHVLHWDGKSHKSINVVDAFLANKKYNSPARLQKTLTVAGDSSGKNSRVQQNDVLFLDDGDDMPDIFIGFNDGTDFLWMNRFILADQDFQLEAMDFYMRTENANSNPIYAAALDPDFNVIVDGNLDLGLSPNGDWFTLTFDPPIQFSAGDTFGLAIGASGVIGFPAGADQDATVPDNSFFLDPSTGNFINLNTQADFAQGAFLVRAVGTLSGTKPPAERLTVSPASGSIAPGNSQNITVTLDATGLAEGTYQGEVKISSNGGNLTLPLQMIVSQTVDVEDVASLPETFTLQQNFPNPFNPETTIRYSLPAHARVSLVIYDLRGRRVALLESNENKQAGEYRVIWNGKDNQGKTLPSGIYIYQLKAELSNGQTIRASRKMTLLK